MMLETDQQPGLAIGQPQSARHREEKAKSSIPGTKLFVLIENSKVLEANGERQLALNMLRVACTWAGTHPIFLKHFADMLSRAKHISEEMIIRKQLSKYSVGFDSLVQQAQCELEQGQDDAAMSSYYEALALLREEDPRLFDVYKNMGNIFVRRGDFESAEEFYNRAHTLNSKSDVLLVNFGTLEMQRGNFEKAKSFFRKAVEINKENDRGWAGLALVHNEFGDHELAMGNICRTLDLNPMNRTAVVMISHWAARLHRWQEAIPWVQNFLENVESDDEISLIMIQLFCAIRRYDLAKIESIKALAWSPQNQDLMKVLQTLSQMETQK